MKKGFTLIELLAVILILGIIALIAVPQVTNTIEKSKKGAAETSAKHYIDAVTNAIRLNQLDEDESNDINDGTHNVSDLTVDITGEAPQSGTVVIEEGSVKNANFVINGYTVICTGKGKCSATKQGKGDYVYYQTAGDFTSLEQTTPTRPTEYPVYLKINKNDIAQRQACLYNNGTEFCLSHKDLYETSKQKILDYFGYDASIWTQDSEITIKWTKDDKTCVIDKSSLAGTYTDCYVSSVGAYAGSDGVVNAYDDSAEFSCYVYDDGYAVCRG